METPSPRLEIIRKLGTGGSGHAYLARAIKRDELCVLKIPRNPKYDDVFHNEVQIMQQLKDCPFILQTMGELNINREKLLNPDIEFVSDLGVLLEYTELGTLYELCTFTVPFNEVEAWFVLRQIMSGVKEMHTRQIAHLDLKEPNILLKQGTSGIECRIADFGLAVEDATIIRQRAGTPGYMAPEQHTTKAYDPFKADMYQLGVILFRLVYKAFPPTNTPLSHNQIQEFVGPRHNAKDISISFQLAALIRDLLDHDPKKRPDITSMGNHQWFHITEQLYLKNPDPHQQRIQSRIDYVSGLTILKIPESRSEAEHGLPDIADQQAASE